MKEGLVFSLFYQSTLKLEYGLFKNHTDAYLSQSFIASEFKINLHFYFMKVNQ